MKETSTNGIIRKISIILGMNFLIRLVESQKEKEQQQFHGKKKEKEELKGTGHS